MEIPGQFLLEINRLAQELCTPHQQVVAHLWPIDYHAALAFGCCLVSRLRTEPVGEAFASATAIMRRQADLLGELDGIQPGLSATERLAHDHVAEKLEHVLFNLGHTRLP